MSSMIGSTSTACHARFDGVNGRNMAFACQPRRSRTVDVAKLVPRAFAAASAALVRC